MKNKSTFLDGMPMYRKTKWLRFFIVDRKPKTIVIDVFNTNDQFLGKIGWYGAWRQYVYESEDGIIYNNGCLQDIADVCTSLNDEHKQKKEKL